ncbi:hypothetical protein OR621_05830 [Aeromonas caviae]|uniref:hypothetical protein n=1 Tax=Aeromonas caviae TaxID=648 RepID=UPI00225878A7|nr:hypothetical protein [Aeromonas caviae]MCX4048329.1 hypothetical protein [Aeromonas caviae]MCX4107615.1 hypothetical protein [Aeromonas caviae]MDX7947950.1 hypothetical protein [Aeromonas caviae]
MNDFLDLMPTKQAILSSRELNQVVIDFFSGEPVSQDGHCELFSLLSGKHAVSTPIVQSLLWFISYQQDFIDNAKNAEIHYQKEIDDEKNQINSLLNILLKIVDSSLSSKNNKLKFDFKFDDDLLSDNSNVVVSIDNIKYLLGNDKCTTPPFLLDSTRKEEFLNDIERLGWEIEENLDDLESINEKHINNSSLENSIRCCKESLSSILGGLWHASEVASLDEGFYGGKYGQIVLWDEIINNKNTFSCSDVDHGPLSKIIGGGVDFRDALKREFKAWMNEYEGKIIDSSDYFSEKEIVRELMDIYEDILWQMDENTSGEDPENFHNIYRIKINNIENCFDSIHRLLVSEGEIISKHQVI